MDTVRTELETYHANPPAIAPPQEVLPALVYGGNDKGLIGNACAQAICAGCARDIRSLGILPNFIGPDETLVHAPPNSGFVAAKQDSMYRVQGGAVTEVKGQVWGLWDWGSSPGRPREIVELALTLMVLAHITYFAFCSFFSYLDVVRQDS
jgi:hypothetical protein